jgi:hypothetical protein
MKPYLNLFFNAQYMSLATIVLCDLYNMIKRIFVVNFIYDYKLVANISFKKPFF